jgi:hypothetical protein
MLKYTFKYTEIHAFVYLKPAPTKDIHHIHCISIRYKKYTYLL